jgi:virulence-associated protein VapD
MFPNATIFPASCFERTQGSVDINRVGVAKVTEVERTQGSVDINRVGVAKVRSVSNVLKVVLISIGWVLQR